MSCTYYHWNGGYACRKTGKGVDEDTYYKYCRNYDYRDCPIYKGENSSSSSGCFLTSACTEAKGLPDDCCELTTLRNFRDTYLKGRENGENDIVEYYDKAPLIVAKIKKQTNSEKEFERIYNELVLPCVKHIENNSFEEAYNHYADYFNDLKKKYGI